MIALFKALNVRYDGEKNAIVVDVGEMPSTITHVEIGFPLIKKALPSPMKRIEEIAELQRIIHQTRKKKLLKIQNYVEKIEEVAKGLKKARKNLENAGTKNEITKWRHVCAMWGKEKDIIKEVRFSIKVINAEEAKLEMEIAKLKTGKT